MNLAPIIARLRDECPTLKVVAGAAEWERAREQVTNLPAVFVMPAADGADPSPFGNEIVQQRVRSQFVVSIAVRNLSFKDDAAAFASLEPVRVAIRDALLAWQPDYPTNDMDGCEFGAGQFDKFDNGVLWWWDSLYKVLDPYLVVANAMPKTAFVPIFYIWLGAALSVYGMSLAISLFITILMIYSGFQGIDPNKIKLAQTFGASKAQILAKVVLPGSVPTLIAALKVNAGLSLVGVVVGEFQSANLGLGYLIVYGSQILKMNIVMTAITLLAIVSSLMYLAIAWLETAVMRRR